MRLYRVTQERGYTRLVTIVGIGISRRGTCRGDGREASSAISARIFETELSAPARCGHLNLVAQAENPDCGSLRWKNSLISSAVGAWRKIPLDKRSTHRQLDGGSSAHDRDLRYCRYSSLFFRERLKRKIRSVVSTRDLRERRHTAT